MIGALICFTGDILLGFFTPAPDFMNKYVGSGGAMVIYKVHHIGKTLWRRRC